MIDRENIFLNNQIQIFKNWFFLKKPNEEVKGWQGELLGGIFNEEVIAQCKPCQEILMKIMDEEVKIGIMNEKRVMHCYGAILCNHTQNPDLVL